jgi:hypothetical protein
MNWAETKKIIAANFCRTVLVLDDEILVHTDGTKDSLDHAEQFLKAKQKFAEKGILCDLRQVDQTVAADSDSMKASLRHADVVVVDWYLGVNSGKDPSQSLSVLEELLKIGGERFVAIHSQEVDSTIRERLQARFELTSVFEDFQGESEDEDVTPLIEGQKGEVRASSSPKLFTLSPKKEDGDQILGMHPQSRIHLCILHKRTPSETAEALPSAILTALERAFPDHLHWVGLEFASRVKDMLPGLIRSLPLDMDVALVFQALVQSPDELADDIAECFCLELQELFRIEPLASARDDSVLSQIKERITRYEKTEIDGVPPEWLSRFFKAKPPTTLKTWVKRLKLLDDIALMDQMGLLIEGVLNQPSGLAYRSHLRYSALREHLHCAKQNDLKLYPGVVLNKILTDESGQESEAWMLCLTPACDCVRPRDHNHLFVSGYEVNEEQKTMGRGIRTSIYANTREIEVKWMMKSFQTITCSLSGPNGWTPITRLRDPIVQKIVQSLWGQQSRVGINTSEYQRVIRKGKEDQ